MKKHIRSIALALLVVSAVGAMAFASGEKVLVSLSYLTGTYESALTETLKKQTDELDRVYEAALAQLGALNSQTAGSSWKSTDTFQMVYPRAGETVTLSSGSSLVWYSGSGVSSSALIDVTAGAELAAGATLTAGHRYLADGQTVLTAGAASSCGVQGLWQTTATGTAPVQSPFSDVASTDFWFEPVLWAVETGVTTGTSAAAFSPRQTCDRAQIVTFLWRAAGSPEPVGGDVPFADVKEGQYYTKAVLWAVEQGITTGTSATTFSPAEPCNRAQAVTFLWRAVGSPEAEAVSSGFTDVKSGQYYTQAVLWAVEAGVTTGTSAATFSPDVACGRGQIVTFLYRVYGQ